MDLTRLLPEIPALLEELDALLAPHTTVACLETMKWLGAFMCIPAVHKSLVGAATTEAEGDALVQRHNPSLLIVSQHLESGTGLSLVARSERRDRSIKTLLVADDANEVLVREALARGCDGICFQSERFMPALKVVAGGGVYYPREVAGVLRRRGDSPPADALTERELEVLEGLMLGLTDRRIGERLFVTPETVKTHVKHIFQKLAVENRTQAAVKGLAAGLISLEGAMAGRLGDGAPPQAQQA
ncbi:response regulator transcription factor [Cyanobium sp. CH-040]|uniref:response regulator transcription factor n=1 Tax=Cyanobium sp. CH-040 TaxID=2823708 RepID=UPI0020CFB209|nr:response regulator transcription factor [Cyanobium sp. CH-040]MCP9928820.1 response regulator transcription factor [Cyanobium sp. CH-040]